MILRAQGELVMWRGVGLLGVDLRGRRLVEEIVEETCVGEIVEETL